MEKLGKKVVDTLTGFAGVATIVVSHWRGGTWYTVIATDLKDGKIVEETIPDERLQLDDE